MTATHADDLVAGYLSRLDAALSGLPEERREEIVEEIAAHIADERARMTDGSDADVLNLLDRMGEPSEVAAEAVDGATPPPEMRARRLGAVEILALVLLPFIWPIGVILLWVSPVWRTRDKVIGTVLSLGGYPVIIFVGEPLLLFQGLSASTCSSGSITDSSGHTTYIPQTCTGVMGLPQWEQVVFGIAFLAAVVLVLLMPILVGIYLGTRRPQPVLE